MTFPVPGTPATYTETTGTTTNHPVNLPAVLSGKCIIQFEVDGLKTVTTPAGWTLITSNPTPGSSFDTVIYFGRDLDGTEGSTVTINAGANSRAAAIAVAFTGGRVGFSSNEIAFSSFVEASVTNPDSPSLSPSWGAEDTTWISAITSGDANTTFSAYPTNYTGISNVNSGGGNSGCAGAMAYRQLNAASEDPGAYTYVTARNRTAVTIAIRPASPSPVLANPNFFLPFLVR
jgi:hypothetical protein